MVASITASPIPGSQRHFYVIDLMRGLAALAVLFWHYQHFYYLTPAIHDLSPAESMSEPGYAFLWPLYAFGHYAVQLFWLISGFVFAAVYLPPGTTTRHFIVNRFARLYPLHLITLCVVAILQAISVGLVGRFQIYPFNDAYHFVLNLFMASWWGAQKGYSFNGPIWTVSIEVLVYGLFWVTLPYLFRKGIVGPLLLAATGWVAAFVFEGHLHYLRECIFYFFAGAVVLLVFNLWRDRPWRLFGTAVVLGLAGALLLAANPTHATADAYSVPLIAIALLLAGCGIEALPLQRHAKRVQWIGDSTYGIYLWHIPTQIVALIFISLDETRRAYIHEWWFLIGFLVTVLVLARLSFVYIERPAREWLRRYAGPKNPPAPSAAPSSPPPHREPHTG